MKTIKFRETFNGIRIVFDVTRDSAIPGKIEKARILAITDIPENIDEKKILRMLNTALLDKKCVYSYHELKKHVPHFVW